MKKTTRLTKEQAAEILHCSTRKIERLARQGQLSCEYETRECREVATFDEREVRALSDRESAPTHRAVAEMTALTRRAPTARKPAPTKAPGLLPPQALAVMQMFGAPLDHAAAMLSGEETSIEQLTVAADGRVEVSGFRQQRWHARH